MVLSRLDFSVKLIPRTELNCAYYRVLWGFLSDRGYLGAEHAQKHIRLDLDNRELFNGLRLIRDRVNGIVDSGGGNQAT